MKIIQEISTHKAVKTGKEIQIIQKGLTIDGKVYLIDEILYTIPAQNEDDVFAIFEDLEETNRCNVAEIQNLLS